MQAQLQNSLDCQKDSNTTFPTAFTLQHVDNDPGNISNCTVYHDQDASVFTQRLELPGVPPGGNGLFSQVFLFEDDACTVKKPSGGLTPFTVLYSLAEVCILANYAQTSWGNNPKHITFRAFPPGPLFCNLLEQFFEYELTHGICTSSAQVQQPNCSGSCNNNGFQNTVMAGVGSLVACVGSCPIS